MDPFWMFLHPGFLWVFFVFGAMGVARALKYGHHRPAPRRPVPPRVQQPARPLPRVRTVDAAKFPPSVQMKVEQIRRKADGILQYASQFPVGSEELYVVQRTGDEYLQATLNAYLRLPPGSHNQPVAPGGRTAWEELWDQLNLLERKLDEIAGDLQRRNAEHLVANGRFLEERFRKREDDLDPTQPPSG
ncbi:MAG: hypothetical protein J2P40_10595 [Candidatus Dormibacteraeota bacterium]|nr:hypothetical protein [Candidatus Dormibacteraeota bacterium]MBO0761710.1 hypothetical protein [Candidatus Dormibacteraeota bacterium]